MIWPFKNEFLSLIKCLYVSVVSLCLSHNHLSLCSFTEANPEKFNSRFRNKMFYAGVGRVPVCLTDWVSVCFSVCVTRSFVPSGGFLGLPPAELQGPVQARQGGGEYETPMKVCALTGPVCSGCSCPLMLTLPLFTWCFSLITFLLYWQCDGTDLTPKIQELKFQCIVFLNIPRCVQK